MATKTPVEHWSRLAGEAYAGQVVEDAGVMQGAGLHGRLRRG